jgi:hypothetical protein
MKLRLLLLSLSLGLVLPAFSQIDVTQLTADTKTFIFDDDKNTVKNYIYQELEVKTSCCGAARIYLEVKIAPSGYVLNAKTLTGKNDCYKKSAIDIVKNIKWNAAGFQGPKSVYFEIKPEIDCGDRANAYESLPIFNNGELDVNGVPVNYANSTGVSALNASGGAPTGVPNPTVDPALANNTSEGEGEGESGNEGAGEENTEPENTVAENNPPASNTGAEAGDAGANEAETNEPIAEANTNKPASTTTTPSQSELDKAREMAKIKEDREKQASEIEKLKAELEAVKKQEEDRKAEQARIASAEKDRQQMEERRRQREEEDRARRAAQRDRQDQDRYASNDRDRNSRYDDKRRGDYDDPYADNSRRDDGYTDPPRPMSEAERKADEQRKLEDELRDIQSRMREMENEERRREADRRRMQQDLARVQERALLKGEEVQQAREREELEKLEQQRRDAEQKKREQEELVRRQMDEIKRMQLEMERKMADLERLEKELTDKEAQKLTTEQQVAKNQEMRKAEIERQIDAIKMQAGISTPGSNAAPIANNPSIPINISANDSNALSLLVQQIAQLRNDINALQTMVVNNQSGGSYGGTRGATTRSNTRVVTSSSANNAAKSNSWKKTDYRNPDDKKAEIYNAFNSNEGVKKANEHKNMTIGKMAEPKFAGSSQAMKKEVAQKLQAGGVCGLVQTTFILTVSPSGEVVGYDITFANTPAVQLQLGPILKGLKFQSTPSTRMVSRALYELKAEIVCEGEERINIKDVPDLINQ